MKLIDICNPKQWKTISSSNLIEEGYPVFGANGIIGYYSEYNHKDPTICITCRGATCGSVNISLPYSYITGNSMALDEIDESKYTLDFLYYYLQYRGFDDVISGSAQPQITRQALSKIIIPDIEMNKQNKIVKEIISIDDLIKKKKVQYEYFLNLVKSRFHEMFFEKGYPVLQWNDVFNTTTGKLDSNAMVEDGEYPFFTCAKEVFRIDKYAFNQEALLLAGNNAAGKYDVKHYKGKFNAYQRTYVLGLKQEWSYKLFQYQLEDKLIYLQQQSLGGLTKYLTMKILCKLSFIIPPVEKQIEFEKFTKQVDKSQLAGQMVLKLWRKLLKFSIIKLSFYEK